MVLFGVLFKGFSSHHLIMQRIYLLVLLPILAVQIYFLLLLPLTRIEYAMFAIIGVMLNMRVGIFKKRIFQKYLPVMMFCIYVATAVLDPVLKIHMDVFFGVNTVGDFMYSFLLNGLTFSGFFVWYFMMRISRKA